MESFSWKTYSTAILDSILSPLVAYNNNEMNTYQARNTEVMQEQKENQHEA